MWTAAQAAEQTEGGRGYGWYRDGDGRLIKLKDNVANITSGMEPNVPLAYDPGSELHRLTMSTLGAHGGKLEKEG